MLWRKEATESHNRLSTSACFFRRTLEQSSLKASEMNFQEHLDLVWFVFHSLPHRLPVPAASFFWSNTICVLSYRRISAHIVPCSCMALPSQPTHFWGTLGAVLLTSYSLWKWSLTGAARAPQILIIITQLVIVFLSPSPMWDHLVNLEFRKVGSLTH